MSSGKPFEETIKNVKPELHAGMTQTKEIIERYLRLAFNPEESPTKLLIFGSIVLRIGVGMILAACREFHQTEDESYEAIDSFITKWRESDKKAKEKEEVPNV